MKENGKLDFDQVMKLIDHIGDQEKHFNNLETEYRKLASQWLLVSLGAIGYLLTIKSDILPINRWALVISVCIVSSIGILVLWLLDLKVYHKLLFSVFKEGVRLENEYSEFLPPVRNNMVDSAKEIGGTVINRLILYYFFSILLLIIIANISVWMLYTEQLYIGGSSFVISAVTVYYIFKMMTDDSDKLSKKYLSEYSSPQK